MGDIEGPTQSADGLARGDGSDRGGTAPPDDIRNDVPESVANYDGSAVVLGSLAESTSEIDVPASKALAVPQGKGLRRVMNRTKARAVAVTVRDRAVALAQDERARATASAVGAVAGAAAVAMYKAAVEERVKANPQMGKGATGSQHPAAGFLEALLADRSQTGDGDRGVLEHVSDPPANRRDAEGGRAQSSRAGSFYPTEPGQLEASYASAGQLRAHPSINALTLEVSMTGFSSYCFAIEWPGVVTRTFFTADDLDDDWRLPFVTEPPTPLKLRRVSSTTIEFIFLDPAGVPEAMWEPSSGKKRTQRQMSESLSDIHRNTPRWRS